MCIFCFALLETNGAMLQIIARLIYNHKQPSAAYLTACRMHAQIHTIRRKLAVFRRHFTWSSAALRALRNVTSLIQPARVSLSRCIHNRPEAICGKLDCQKFQQHCMCSLCPCMVDFPTSGMTKEGNQKLALPGGFSFSFVELGRYRIFDPTVRRFCVILLKNIELDVSQSHVCVGSVV